MHGSANDAPFSEIQNLHGTNLRALKNISFSGVEISFRVLVEIFSVCSLCARETTQPPTAMVSGSRRARDFMQNIIHRGMDRAGLLSLSGTWWLRATFIAVERRRGDTGGVEPNGLR